MESPGQARVGGGGQGLPGCQGEGGRQECQLGRGSSHTTPDLYLGLEHLLLTEPPTVHQLLPPAGVQEPTDEMVST